MSSEVETSLIILGAMKITIVLGAFFPVPPIMGGAVEKVWFELGQEFARRGHEVVQISRAHPSLPKSETIEGVRHIRVRGFAQPRSIIWLKFLDLLYSLRVRRALPEADIVVTNTFWLPILLRDSKRGRIYVQVARYPKGQMRFYGKAARLQVPSHAIAHAIAAEAPGLANKIAVVPNPAPTSTSAAPPPPIADRPKTILYVGRVHPEKGVHALIDAFVRGKCVAFKGWNLMIVGPTETKFGGGGNEYFSVLKRSAAESGDRVMFAGPIFDQTALEKTLRFARLFVYPSLAERGESFGLAPLEAMLHGCAVLVSRLDCFGDLIRDGETGFVFDHRTSCPADSLRQKMETVIGDEILLARVAAAGQRKSTEYSLPQVSDRFIADFNSLVQTSDVANR